MKSKKFIAATISLAALLSITVVAYGAKSNDDLIIEIPKGQSESSIITQQNVKYVPDSKASETQLSTMSTDKLMLYGTGNSSTFERQGNIVKFSVDGKEYSGYYDSWEYYTSTYSEFNIDTDNLDYIYIVKNGKKRYLYNIYVLGGIPTLDICKKDTPVGGEWKTAEVFGNATIPVCKDGFDDEMYYRLLYFIDPWEPVALISKTTTWSDLIGTVDQFQFNKCGEYITVNGFGVISSIPENDYIHTFVKANSYICKDSDNVYYTREVYELDGYPLPTNEKERELYMSRGIIGTANDYHVTTGRTASVG